LIAQVIVERVTSNWLTSGGAPEARPQLCALLDRAQSLTRNADFALRIAAVRRSIAQAAPDAPYEAVGGELMRLLRWHAALTPRPRPVPSNWWQFPLYRSNIVDFVLAACAGALVWQATYLFVPSAGPAIWEPLARFLAIVLLVHALLGAA